jgi:hypothetical protein
MYTKITSKYPNINKPDMSNPRMRPTELPHQPKMINPGISRPKDKLKPRIPHEPTEVDTRKSKLRDLIQVYNKYPGRKYPSA